MRFGIRDVPNIVPRLFRLAVARVRRVLVEPTGVIPCVVAVPDSEDEQEYGDDSHDRPEQSVEEVAPGALAGGAVWSKHDVSLR